MAGARRPRPQSKQLGLPMGGPVPTRQGVINRPPPPQFGGGGQAGAPPSGLQAVRQMYGGYWKPDPNGQALKLNSQNAQRMMTGLFSNELTQSGEANPNYRPSPSQGMTPTPTPMMNLQGNRMGEYDAAAGQFNLAGRRRPRTTQIGGAIY